GAAADRRDAARGTSPAATELGAGTEHRATTTMSPPEATTLAEPEPDLRLRIDPSWGDRKVFHAYRATLSALHRNGAPGAARLDAFRAANAAIEARLRRKLPGWIEQLDVLYADRRGEPPPC